MAAVKKEEKKAIKTALVVGTQPTLSNLFRDFRYLWLGTLREPGRNVLAFTYTCKLDTKFCKIGLENFVTKC